MRTCALQVACLFELDILEMFPRLCSDGVIEAISQIARAFADAIAPPKPHGPSKLRAGSNSPLFSIHCGYQELNRLGGGYTVNIYILSMTDILAHMNFHVFCNAVFAIGSSVAKQQHGSP